MASEAPMQRASVREACLRQAAEIIATEGVHRLSLREVSRRLTLSHQAPYKHFASREALLAEVICRAFDDFTQFLRSRIEGILPDEELPALGLAYLEYARLHPLEYRLMCETPMPDLARHPGLREKTTGAFDLLFVAIAKLRAGEPQEDIHALALFAWSAAHGLASIIANGGMQTIGITDPESHREAVQAVLEQICSGVIGKHPVEKI